MKDVNLYLIRHGETQRNVNTEIIGQDADEPLNNNGVVQAKLLGRYFGIKNISFDRVYYSTYKRAKDTWKLARENFESADKLGVAVDSLVEYNAGDMKGQSRKEVYGNPELLASMDELGMLFKFPNGESLYEVQQRTISWLNGVALSDHVRNENDTIALFSHGMVIKTILQYYMQFEQRMTWRIKINNTSITFLSRKNGAWHINCVNATPHLE